MTSTSARIKLQIVIAYILSVVAIAFIPTAAFAQQDLFTTTQNISDKLLDLVGTFSSIAFVAMIAFFFWGLARFILGGAEDKKVARNMMIWGTVAIFIAASIWGIVYVLRDTFGVGDQTTIPLPGVI